MKKILVITIGILTMLTGCGGKNTTPDIKKDISEIKQETINLEEIYGTWTFSKVNINDSEYTIKELEALGDNSLSDIYIVLKKGGFAYMSEKGESSDTSWNFNEGSNCITIGTRDFKYKNKELVCTTDNGIIYMSKYSDSQDITEVPNNILDSEVVESDNQKQEENSISDNTIRPEIKEAIDAYESFIDEYCEFMKKYSESDGTDLAILADYAIFLSKYSEMESKMENLENDLTTAESLYYSEVMLRCSQKMLNVTY